MFSVFSPEKAEDEDFRNQPKTFFSSLFAKQIPDTVLKHSVSIFRVSEFPHPEMELTKNAELLAALWATHFQIRCIFLLKNVFFHKYTVVLFSWGSEKQLMSRYSVSKPTAYFSEYCFKRISLKLFY